jgi:hypothetical protein
MLLMICSSEQSVTQVSILSYFFVELSMLEPVIDSKLQSMKDHLHTRQLTGN